MGAAAEGSAQPFCPDKSAQPRQRMRLPSPSAAVRQLSQLLL